MSDSGPHSPARPRITLVAAVSENGVIGRDGGLPWRLPEDLKHFKRTTFGGIVVMGRRTWEELGGSPLPKRRNLVLTRRDGFEAPGAEVVGSLEDAIDLAEADGAAELFVIGGGVVYAEALEIADRLVLTTVHAHIEGDTEFPRYSEEDWRESRRWTHPADDRHAHAMTFRVLLRA